MEIKIHSIACTPRPDADAAADAERRASEVVLEGEGLAVERQLDCEALLARLQLEDDLQKRRTLLSSLSSALAVLAGRRGAISAAQGAALADVSAATSAVGQATQAVASAASAYNVSVAALVALEAKLGPAVDPQEVKALKAAIAAQKAVVAADKAELDKAETNRKAAESALTASLARLDRTMLLTVSDAVRNAARDIAAAAAEQPGGKEREETASAIVRTLGEYADRLQALRDEELGTVVAKLATDIVFLVQNDFLVGPADLPDYEQNV